MLGSFSSVLAHGRVKGLIPGTDNIFYLMMMVEQASVKREHQRAGMSAANVGASDI